MDTAKKHFEVFELSKNDKNSFIEAFVWEKEDLTSKLLKEKPQIDYLFSYLCESSDTNVRVAQTALVEKHYVSRSYLYDYSNYYALGFKQLANHCRRIHFFSTKVTQEEFEQIFTRKEPLSNCDSRHLFDDNYLGYVILRPLLHAPFGAAILKPYPESADKDLVRIFKPVKRHHINIYGIHTEFKTMIWLSQDKNVSKCATAALYMAFGVTSKLFRTHQPSPYHITKAAGNDYKAHGRDFPNSGLDQYQILNAIKSVGLVGDVQNGKDNFSDNINYFKALANAYNHLGLPVLFLLKYMRQNKGKSQVEGYHLTVLSGLKKTKVTPKSYYEIAKDSDSYQMSFESDKIENMYIHDDNHGVFIKTEMAQNTEHKDKVEKTKYNWSFNSACWPKDRQAFVVSTYVPIRENIKIAFREMYNFVHAMDAYMMDHHGFKFEWDIYLDYSNDFKDKFASLSAENEDMNEELHKHKDEIIFSNMPKYIWVIKARSIFKVDEKTEKKIVQLQILIDATGVIEFHNILHFFASNSLKRELSSELNLAKELKAYKIPEYYISTIENKIKN